jgi:hypothetical protein
MNIKQVKKFTERDARRPQAAEMKFLQSIIQKIRD